MLIHLRTTGHSRELSYVRTWGAKRKITGSGQDMYGPVSNQNLANWRVCMLCRNVVYHDHDQHAYKTPFGGARHTSAPEQRPEHAVE